MLGRTFLVSGLTFGSRILGFIREMLSASIFGATSPIFDAFLTAWRVPNLFRRFLGEGALSTSLVARLTEVDEDEGEAAGANLFWGTMRLAAGTLSVLCAVVMAMAYLLPNFVSAQGLEVLLGKDPGPVLELTIRLAPFVILICLSALIGGALNVRGHYLMPCVGPVLLNVAWILSLVLIGIKFAPGSPALELEPGLLAGSGSGALTAAEYTRHMAMTRVLAWGVLVAGFLQLACQLGPLRKLGFRGAPKVKRAPGGPSARTVLLTALPLAFGAAVYQINVMVDGLMAEWLPDGGPTSHYYANRIQQFPLALIAIAAMNSVFPRLKQLGHRRDFNGLRGVLDKTQLGVAFLALPASCGLFLLATPMARLVFEHGAFDANGTARVAGALSMLALALLPAGAVLLMTRAYYALDDYRTPVVVSSLMLMTNIVLNFTFLFVLKMDVEGLALGTAISTWGNLALLTPGLSKRLAGSDSLGARMWAQRLALMLVASLIAGGFALGAHSAVEAALANTLGSTVRGIVSLFAAFLAGTLSYLALSILTKAPELAALRARISKR